MTRMVLILALVRAAQTVAATSPITMCLNPLLTRQEQDLCKEQVTHAQTPEELKRIQARYRDKIKGAEENKKAR